MNNKIILDTSKNNCIFKLRDIISEQITYALNSKMQIAILCIGTDRSTGDSLGPLVGDKLKFLVRDKVVLYGNLENPVHAKNLSENLRIIKDTLEDPFIIAIDASLGSISNVGKIIVEKGPLIPGAALNKNLPPVGNVSIKGIVNISGSLEFLVLQNTRLYTVMNLADIISKGLYHSILKTIGGPKPHKEALENFAK
ncbi:spore protease YyaC [Haloimpatiens lingqiaonensis]|uniref:spore protease YyaC n=1 Tax=Haloimpatiens lingqiaonensis TaxID=1380675 RepID=UPI0010FF092D|nr:spore protease YyaC [Haloimpatiens lingqiaonensis]